MVNLIDQRVLHPRPDYVSYYLSKSVLHVATQTLAQALAPRICTSMPSGRVRPCRPFLRTPEEFAAEAAGDAAGPYAAMSPISPRLRSIPAHARSVTSGQMLAVDGGQHLAWTKQNATARMLRDGAAALQAHRAADAPAIYRGYASRPEATRFMHFVQLQDLSQAQAFAGRCESCWQDGSAFPGRCWPRTTAVSSAASSCALNRPRRISVISSVENEWGRGYATEAATAVVRWVEAQTPDIFRVWATCHP